ncbi:MAG: hypothetical protein ACREJ2_02940 [Planctomycetota bacterium]
MNPEVGAHADSKLYVDWGYLAHHTSPVKHFPVIVAWNGPPQAVYITVWSAE